jgi:hypothetical protein
MEDKKVYLVIFNSCLHRHKKGSISLTPSAEEVEEVLKLNPDLQIHLMDMEYSYMRQARLDVEPNEWNMLDDKETVEEMIFEKGSIEELEGIDRLSIIEEYLPFTDIRYKDKNVLYLYYNNDEFNNVKDEYDLMHFCEDYFPHNGEKKAYIVREKAEDLVSLVTDFLSDKIPLPYNPWTGGKMEGHVLHLYREGLMLVIYYLQAGFHLYKKEGVEYPQIWIPSWCFNVETPYLKGIIHYYSLMGENQVHRPDVEICQSADYRETLTTCLVHVLSNFAVNNRYLKKDVKDWYDYRVYEDVLSQINKELRI